MEDPELEELLGTARRHLAAGEWPQAASLFKQALNRDSASSAAHFGLGVSLMELGRLSEATAAFRETLRLDPGHAGAWAQLGRIEFAEGHSASAAESFGRSLALDPNQASTHLNAARALAREIRPQEAERHLRKAILLDPDLSEAHLLLGFQLQEFGKYEEAGQAFERVLALKPISGAAHLGLATSMRIADRCLLDRVNAALSNPGLTPADARDLHYAAGKALNDLGSYGEALREFELGHALAQANATSMQRRFDEEGYAQHIEAMVKAFTPDVLSVNVGSPSRIPIFLVGMPRSGSTLVEQILSSHPRIGAAGELLFWRNEGRQIYESVRRGTIAEGSIRPIAERYLALLDRLGGGKSHVTDKMPNNFLYLGAIHIAFPEARIVHCRRHPVDNCLSMYMTPSRNPGPLAWSKSTLAFAYERYALLMEHWRASLPDRVFLDVDYEALLDDPENQVRRLLNFVGVEWDENCLHPENNTRTVSTPSNWQVRQPLYNSSVARWKRYREHLGPLERLLSDAEKASG